MRRGLVLLSMIVAIAGVIALVWWVTRKAHATSTTPSSQAPISAGKPDPAPLPPRAFAEVAAEELAQMRPGLTLREYIQSHSEERPSLPGKGDLERFVKFGHYCALVVRSLPLDTGAVAERIAAFYIPPAPTPLVPPVRKEPAELINDCLLGAIYIRTPVAEAAQADQLAPAVLSTFSARFGNRAPAFPEPPNYFAATRWSHFVGWKSGDITYGTGYDTYKTKLNDVNKYAAYAVVPLYDSEKDFGTETWKLNNWWEFTYFGPDEGANFEFALKAADLDAPASAAMADAYSRVAAWRAKRLAGQSDPAREARAGANGVVAALKQALEKGDSLPPQRRAAAFLAAYYLTGLVEEADDKSSLALLDDVGAKFWKPTTDADLGRSARWLELAFDLDPHGAIGDTIIFEQMNQECYFGGLYGIDTPLFEHVIPHAEEYLGRAHTPGDAAMAKFLLASAYQDLVNVASGGEPGTDPAPFKSRMAEARDKAVENYAAAIKFDPNSRAAKIAWRKSWELLANLPMGRVHYLCFVDDVD